MRQTIKVASCKKISFYVMAFQTLRAEKVYVLAKKAGRLATRHLTHIASQCVLKSNKCEVYVPPHSCQ